MKRSLLRLSLIIAFLALLSAPFFLRNQRSSFLRNSNPPSLANSGSSFLRNSNPSSLANSGSSSSLKDDEACSFFLGLKPPFPKEQASSFVFEKDLLSFISSLPPYLKKENWGLVLPLVLTKEEEWLISYKTFLFINHKREEISHLSLKEIQSVFNKPSQLKNVLKLFPNRVLFLRPLGKDFEKIFKNLRPLYQRKNVFVALQAKELTEALLKDSAPSSLVQSFKSLVRLSLMDLLGLAESFPLPAEGIEIPASFSLSPKLIFQLKSRKKKLYLNKEAPFSDIPSYLQPALSGILTFSHLEGARFIKNKNPCHNEKERGL